MTIDEALTKIKQKDRCWVIWDSDTGEVLSVDRFERNNSLGSPNRCQIGRLLTSANISRTVLELQERDILRANLRGRILTEWYEAPFENVLLLLERGQYEEPMQKDFDSDYLVDHLWKVHRDDWQPVARVRLSTLIATDLLSPSASQHLGWCLHALDGREADLLALWRNPASTYPYNDTWHLMECLAHTGTKDAGLINDLVRMIGQDGLFEPRRIAVRTLAQIGHAAWPEAAAAIRSNIRDGEPWITAFRDRALERIGSPDEEWTRCSHCCFGYIHPQKGHGVAECPACFGIGVTRIDSRRHSSFANENIS